MNFLQKINMVWQRVGIVQRALLIAIIMACVITGLLLTKWASKADMRLLYSGLTPEEAGQIVDQISEAGVLYELRGGGSSIYVPSDQVDRLRLTMAQKGLLNDTEGYGLFDKEKIGVSPLVQQLNKVRAIEGEIAKSIQMIEGVVSAKVHLVLEEETMFAAETSEGATASVVLKLKPGWRLNPSSVAAITSLVASAAKGLTAEKVTIIDSMGNLLTTSASKNPLVSSANTFMDYKDRVEQTIAAKIQEMLDMVLGIGRATVKVSAVLDMSNTVVKTTTYQKGIAEEETITKTSMAKASTTDAQGNEKKGDLQKEDVTESKFKLPETTTTQQDVPGKITSVSVAAFVDLSVTGSNQEQPQEGVAAEETAKSAPAMTIDDVKAIIKNAVGPELLTGDDAITVKNIPFHKPLIAAAPDDSLNKLTRYIEIARHSSMGVLAVCALVVLKIFSGAKKKVPVEEEIAAPSSMDALSMGLLPASTADDSSLALRHHISKELKEHPERVKMLFNTWLAEER